MNEPTLSPQYYKEGKKSLDCDVDFLDPDMDLLSPDIDSLQAVLKPDKKPCSHQHVSKGVCLYCWVQIDPFTGKVKKKRSCS